MNRLNRLNIGLFIILSLFVLIRVSAAAENASAYSLEAGGKLSFGSSDATSDFSELCELEKVKKKKDVLEHHFKYESLKSGITFIGNFILDEKGCFHECSGIIQDPADAGVIHRFNSSRKGTDIRLSSAWKDEIGRGPKFNIAYNGIPDDTWVLMDGAVFLGLYLSLEPLAADYNQIKQFIILNPFTEERRAGKTRIQVTGETTVDLNGQTVPAYIVTMDVPKYVFTMKPEDQNLVGKIVMNVSKADKKLLKLDSTDLGIQYIMKP